MFCEHCGKENKDGASFCARCGKTLPKEESGAAKEIIEPAPLTKKEKRTAKKAQKKAAKKEKKAQRKAEKKAKKKAKWAAKTFGQKVKSVSLRFLVWMLVLAVVAAGVIGVLVYFDLVNIPFVNDFLIWTGIKSHASEDMFNSNGVPKAYEVTPPDADSYFENNGQVISVIDINDSDAVQTEAEIYALLADRGFGDYPITTEYAMDGVYYGAAEISTSSSAKHPMYQTYYVTANSEVWTILVINDTIIANPVSYNMQSSSGIQVVFSETNTITSYDSTTNKFYETIPKESVMIVKTVGRIDAQTLEQLTMGEIDDYD